MGIQIAHFPAVKSLEDFDFKFQPSVDQKLVRELAVGRYIAQAENVLILIRPASVRPTSPSRSDVRPLRRGTPHSSPAPPLSWRLAKSETEGQLAERLGFFAKPKLRVVDWATCRS